METVIGRGLTSYEAAGSCSRVRTRLQRQRFRFCASPGQAGGRAGRQVFLFCFLSPWASMMTLNECSRVRLSIRSCGSDRTFQVCFPDGEEE